MGFACGNGFCESSVHAARTGLLTAFFCAAVASVNPPCMLLALLPRGGAVGVECLCLLLLGGMGCSDSFVHAAGTAAYGDS